MILDPTANIKTHPSYDEIHNACVRFVDSYKAMYEPPAVVLGLSRGGLVPAVIISHCFDVPMQSVEYSSHKGNGDNKNHKNYLPDFPLDTSSLLIVDDICDSGHTIREVVNHYHSQGYTVRDFVLYYKKRAVPVHFPTAAWLSIPEDAPWIIFPYEITGVQARPQDQVFQGV